MRPAVALFPVTPLGLFRFEFCLRGLTKTVRLEDQSGYISDKPPSLYFFNLTPLPLTISGSSVILNIKTFSIFSNYCNVISINITANFCYRMTLNIPGLLSIFCLGNDIVMSDDKAISS